MFDLHIWLAGLKRTYSRTSSVRRCRRLRYSAIERLESRQLLAATPVGPEFRVNSATPNSQAAASMAMDADGDFVVTWESNLQDGGGYGIYAQRYNAAGVVQGDEFRVNTTTANEQRNATVAIDADGDFVVTWQSYGQDTATSYGISAQRYNAAGVAHILHFADTTTPA